MNYLQQEHMHDYVHSSLICNNQKMETTQLPFNGRTDIKNGVHLHNGYYSAIKNEDVMNFAGKWMELDIIILTEIIHTPNDMHGMYSLISGYKPKRLEYIGYTQKIIRSATSIKAQVRMH